MDTDRFPSDRPWTASTGLVHVVYGDGRLDEIGSIATELGGRRALLVTDPGVRQAGHDLRATAALGARGIAFDVFDGVDENPTEANVVAAVEASRAVDADIIVAVGGGSVMDCAKAVNLVLTNGGEIADYEGHGKATRATLPSIGVPTTAGTGSEAQSYALITESSTHRKMACGDPRALFHTAILDPTLTDTLPRATAASSGVDALSHAVETFVTRKRTEVSRLHAARAWRHLERHLEPALDSPGDHRHWGPVLLGAHFAGVAIEASMLGAAHSCANPLTARLQTTHGVAVALMLPHVVRFNGPVVPTLYAELARDMQDPGDDAEAVAQRFEAIRASAGLPSRLRDVGVSPDALAEMAEEASRQWTLQFNPRPASIDDLRALYETAY